MKLEDQRVLVVGLGESGKAAARFLASRGAVVAGTDRLPEHKLESAAMELRALGVQLDLGGHAESLFLEQDLIIPSPGVPWDLPELVRAREQGVRVAGELEVAAAFLRGPVIGVTGTNGKTTTTALIGHMMVAAGWEVQTGGNIGTPVLAMVDSSADDTWNVLELSSFQLEAMESFHSRIAVVLNVTPDHLDRHQNFEAYASAKTRILRPQTQDDHIVLNADDESCRRFARSARSRICWFSRTQLVSPGAWVEGSWIVFDGRRVVETGLPIRGPHNLENTLAAVATCSLAGVATEEIAAAALSFRPVEHRLEFVRTVDGVDYYNDSKATNVEAATKAIQAFDGGLWVILGGSDKGGDFRSLKIHLASRAHGVLLIGSTAEKIQRQLEGCVPSHRLGTLEAALEFAKSHAKPRHTVLLAPACASFDQFENYQERGRLFKQLVHSWKKVEHAEIT